MVKTDEPEVSTKITLKPIEIKESRGLLIISNNSTKERYEYTLIGVVDEPLAKDNFDYDIQVRDIKEDFIILEKLNVSGRPIGSRQEYIKSRMIATKKSIMSLICFPTLPVAVCMSAIH